VYVGNGNSPMPDVGAAAHEEIFGEKVRQAEAQN
jgi:hypothetical protein